MNIWYRSPLFGFYGYRNAYTTSSTSVRFARLAWSKFQDRNTVLSLPRWRLASRVRITALYHLYEMCLNQTLNKTRKSRLSPYCCYVSLPFSFLTLNDSNELYTLSHTAVTATAETSVVCFIDIHPTETQLEGGNYYADKLLF